MVICVTTLTIEAAETSQPSTTVSNDSSEAAISASTSTSQTESTTASDSTNETEQEPIAVQDTLRGAGLKDRKLSDIFEQFVPSETISADNAVPFPIDI